MLKGMYIYITRLNSTT